MSAHTERRHHPQQAEMAALHARHWWSIIALLLSVSVLCVIPALVLL